MIELIFYGYCSYFCGAWVSAKRGPEHRGQEGASFKINKKVEEKRQEIMGVFKVIVYYFAMFFFSRVEVTDYVWTWIQEKGTTEESFWNVPPEAVLSVGL